jgi:hypothetical protein
MGGSGECLAEILADPALALLL